MKIINWNISNNNKFLTIPILYLIDFFVFNLQGKKIAVPTYM